jgi:hypothetical protein
MPQERHIERREHQDNADIGYEPEHEMVPKEEDIHADDDRHHDKYIKYGVSRASHQSKLLTVHASVSSQGSQTNMPSRQGGYSIHPPSITRMKSIFIEYEDCLRWRFPTFDGPVGEAEEYATSPAPAPSELRVSPHQEGPPREEAHQKK